MIRPRDLLGLAAGALLAGCGDDPGTLRFPRYDPAVFAAEAQPVLERSCAEPSCHGRAERPLALYAPLRRRADPGRLHLDEPLAEPELAANARAVAAFAIEPLLAGSPVDDCLVLRKPLALVEGGAGHLGGASFPSRRDRDYRALRGFLLTVAFAEGARPGGQP